VYENICEKSKKMLFGAPIVLVNKEFWLDEGNIHIQDDKIMIVNEEGIPPVNFACKLEKIIIFIFLFI
jgi:hypothetical protein